MLRDHGLTIIVDLAVPADNQQAPVSPQGTVPQPFTFSFSSVNATQLAGGSIKIADSTTFPIATAISVAQVTVEPGAMRYVHLLPPSVRFSHSNLQGTACMFSTS